MPQQAPAPAEAHLAADLVRDSDSNIAVNTEVIFDANYLSYKKIIDMLYTSNLQQKLSYKIRPNHSQFIIGSDDSINQGQVIILDQ